jgi:hypothetical protein
MVVMLADLLRYPHAAATGRDVARSMLGLVGLQVHGEEFFGQFGGSTASSRAGSICTVGG